MDCVSPAVTSQLLRKYLPISLGAAVVVVGVLLLLIFRWRVIVTELATARLNHMKRG